MQRVIGFWGLSINDIEHVGGVRERISIVIKSFIFKMNLRQLLSLGFCDVNHRKALKVVK